MIAKIFGDASVAAHMGVAASIADLAGTLLAPIVSSKLGLKRAYLWSTGLRVVTGGLIAGLLASGWASLGGITTLLAADALTYGVSFTLEKSIPAVMVNQDQRKLERFKAARQTAIETVATVVPIATGALVAAAGFLPALVAFPVAVAASVTLVALTLRLPAKIAGAAAADLPGPREGSIGAYVKHLLRGAAVIARTPALLLSLLTYSLVYAPTLLIYWMVAPAFALRLAPDAAHATAYAGMITGLYSLGGIVAGAFLMRRGGRARSAEEMRGSMLRWTFACAAAMTLFGALALPGLAWGTLTAPAIAMLLFGFPQVVARLKLESFFQSRVPKDAVADSTAVMEGTSTGVIALGLWWFGKMLAGAHATSLLWIAAAAAPLALPLLFLTWALARATRRNF
ncbi:MAG: hypothetical protein KGJ84_05270 [Elusimicrobia bacterium]|nr:hypothetical protein [Elusimicrobiota bacterium]